MWWLLEKMSEPALYCKYSVVAAVPQCRYADVAVLMYTDSTPPALIETHLIVVRGLPTKKFQTECVNEKSSTERRS